MDFRGANWASALGIQGQARLRAHPRDNHPHIELREIEPPEDAEDTSGATLYFSFFSAKPLNFKAGRELLFSVGRIDKRLEGRAVLLEGDKHCPSRDAQPPQPAGELPLKFRKVRWSGFPDPLTVKTTSAMHSEVGTQVNCPRRDACIQTDSTLRSTAIQVEPSTTSRGIQNSPCVSSYVVQTVPAIDQPLVANGTSRSPSPMEIEDPDSPDYTPPPLEMELAGKTEPLDSPLSPEPFATDLEDMDMSSSPRSVSPIAVVTKTGAPSPTWDQRTNSNAPKETTPPAVTLSRHAWPAVPLHSRADGSLPTGFKADRYSAENSFVSAGFTSDFTGSMNNSETSHHIANYAETSIGLRFERQAPRVPLLPIPGPSLAGISNSIWPSKLNSTTAPPQGPVQVRMDASKDAPVSAASRDPVSTGPHRAWDDPPQTKCVSRTAATTTLENPLGIAPSRHPPPFSPRALMVAAASQKKLTIGTAWSSNKAVKAKASASGVEKRTSALPLPPVTVEHEPVHFKLTPTVAEPKSRWKPVSRVEDLVQPCMSLASSSGTSEMRIGGVQLENMSLPKVDFASSSCRLTRGKTPIESPATSVSSTLVDATSQSVSAIPHTPSYHALPPRPVDSQGPAKRQRVPTTEETLPKKKKRLMRWPTVECTATFSLQGSSDMSIQAMTTSHDGNFIALTCVDKRIRIIDSRTRNEVARLGHDRALINVHWMENDAGIVSLAEDGTISKWTRDNAVTNRWVYAKLMTADAEKITSPNDTCFVYHNDCFAVSFPRLGVCIWSWQRGRWQAMRSIQRKNVTCLKFIRDGSALIGGTIDGVLWHCEIPNGTLRAITNVKAVIVDVDVDKRATCALVARYGGICELVNLDNPRGHVDAVYCNDGTVSRPSGGFGSKFVAYGQGVLYGSVDGCVLVWDTAKGALVYGLAHDEGDIITSVAAFDGATAKDGYIVTATKRGTLHWWSQPASKPPPP